MARLGPARGWRQDAPPRGASACPARADVSQGLSLGLSCRPSEHTAHWPSGSCLPEGSVATAAGALSVTTDCTRAGPLLGLPSCTWGGRVRSQSPGQSGVPLSGPSWVLDSCSEQGEAPHWALGTRLPSRLLPREVVRLQSAGPWGRTMSAPQSSTHQAPSDDRDPVPPGFGGLRTRASQGRACPRALGRRLCARLSRSWWSWSLAVPFLGLYTALPLPPRCSSRTTWPAPRVAMSPCPCPLKDITSPWIQGHPHPVGPGVCLQRPLLPNKVTVTATGNRDLRVTLGNAAQPSEKGR